MGSPWLVDLTDLSKQGLLDHTGSSGCTASDGPAGLPAVQEQATPASTAAEHLLRSRMAIHEAWLAWRANPWVRDMALFQALKRQDDAPWWIWPAELRDRKEDAMAAAEERLHSEVAIYEVLAFLFDHQWARFQAAAEERGILLFGDLPIYVARDSADVWANRAVFELSETGLPERVAGVPPDALVTMASCGATRATGHLYRPMATNGGLIASSDA